MSEGARSQADAERLRYLQTDKALADLRRDLQLRGVSFQWKRKPGEGLGSEVLEAFLKGAAPRPYDQAALALTLLRPLFLHAVITGGEVEPGHAIDTTDMNPREKEEAYLHVKPRQWFVIVWLNATAAEAARREAAHGDLNIHMERVEAGEIERTPVGDRCGHDGAACHHHCSNLSKATTPGHCHRAFNGWNRSTAHVGYPLDGFDYPAKGAQLDGRK